MRIFKRLKMGLVLTKDSLLVIRHNPKLMLFPLVSGVAGVAFLALFLGVTFGLAAVNPEGGMLLGLLLIYLTLTFISSFFTRDRRECPVLNKRPNGSAVGRG